MITYDLQGYESLVDFENRNFRELDEGIDNKDEAIEEGRRYLRTGKYKIVKVQSSDREFIMILQNRNK
jgi:hypothetical protein